MIFTLFKFILTFISQSLFLYVLHYDSILNIRVCTTMTSHGNIRSYLHRLKIIGSLDCPCKHGIQTVGRVIFQCNRLKNERESLKTRVLKVGNWPVSKIELTNRYLKNFIKYINSVDCEKINHSNKQM
jgi:hypothetical protein